MQNLGNVYICGSPFVTSRTDAQNGLDMVFKLLIRIHRCQVSHIKRVTHASASFLTLQFDYISRISRKLAEKLKCREIMVIVKCLN